MMGMIKNQRLVQGKNDFKQGYQTRTNILKDEEGDLVRDCHSILVRRRNTFSWLLYMHGVNNVRQRKLYTAEPLVHESRVFDFEMAIKKLETQITRFCSNPRRID
jgi:hypothetical protein